MIYRDAFKGGYIGMHRDMLWALRGVQDDLEVTVQCFGFQGFRFMKYYSIQLNRISTTTRKILPIQNARAHVICLLFLSKSLDSGRSFHVLFQYPYITPTSHVIIE